MSRVHGLVIIVCEHTLFIHLGYLGNRSKEVHGGLFVEKGDEIICQGSFFANKDRLSGQLDSDSF